MLNRRWSWRVVALMTLALVAGCAKEAEKKVAEAGEDMKQAWIAERDAAAATLNRTVDATARDIEKMRAGAVELEQAAKHEAAAVWRRTADGLEAARDEAAREIATLEAAGEDAWTEAHDAAAATARSLERAGMRVAAFASETKDEFVREARAVVADGEREIAWAKEQLAKADAAAKAEWQAVVKELEEKQKKAVAELAKVEAAEAGAWAEMRHGFVAAYHDLADASKRARMRLEGV